jgi:large subunit ribosomal protein L15
MPTRQRKVRRLRGSRTHGYGQVGQHRHSGKQGGHGAAGLHKHKWSWLVINDPDHYGRDPFKVPGARKIARWMNIGQLDDVAAARGRALETGSDKSQQQDRPFALDLSSLGVQKLLGSGSVRGAYNVKVEVFTERAKTKIEEAGGTIVS